MLLVVMAPLTETLGASQMALNLAHALQELGVDAHVWSPYPKPDEVPWWRELPWAQSKIREYVKKCGPFNVVDSVPAALTQGVGGNAVLVARTVQPDLLYLWASFSSRWSSGKLRLGRLVLEAIFNLYVAALVMNGFRVANRVLCLGSQEFNRMRRWFPWWRSKTAMYVNAIADAERDVLRNIRRRRHARDRGGVRYLWIGRWSAHKGIGTLVDYLNQRAAGSSPDSITIAGGGEQSRQDLRSEIMSGAEVKVVPSFSRLELADLLRHHDIGLFTSSVEGWGLTVQEMLESGMPVYATNAGAVTDLRGEFPDLLRQFPPPAVNPGSPILSELSDEYLARFSWRSIARAYITQVASR